LKDLRAPEGLEVYERLRDALRIPVFHDNLYGTAVVAAAALLNALDLVDKRVEDVRAVLCGAGTVGTGCARLFRALGLPADQLLVYDVGGLLHPDRDDLRDHQRAFARDARERSLADGVRGADVLVAASAAGAVTQEMIRSMATDPIVFALATPQPEIGYEAMRASRRDVVAATALGQDPNAILDLLSVPYVFRGALDVEATRITDGMMLAAARALADLARDDVIEEVERAYGRERFRFGPDYLLPRPIDPRILAREAGAVARAAVEEGVAARAVDEDAYRESLGIRLGTGRDTIRGLQLRARRTPLRVAFADGASETVLRACAILVDEGIARPVLLGARAEIRETVERLGIDLSGVPVADPARDARGDAYVEDYFRLRQRRGVMRAAAERGLRSADRFAAMMVRAGDADVMIAGVASHYAESLRTLVDLIGPDEGVRRIASLYVVLLPRDVVFLADCAVNVDPDAACLAEIALLAADASRTLGFEPRVAMLSFSNFGSVDHPAAGKVRRATELVRERDPGLVVDGEMQLAAAREGGLRERYFPFCRLDRDANVLIFPDLQSGNLALHALQYMAEAVPIGPVLLGTRFPAHLTQYGATVEEIVNLTTVGVVQAAARRE